ncbi:MAG: TonB-dependent receptor plug domain-containing protein [Saprospiraceae bacterium]|nr:TonB-dependent receptor plug domain-containing protein [Lewinella sp.]
MKHSKIFFPILSLILVMVFSACATTYDASDRTATQEEEMYRDKMVRTVDNPLSLEDFLVRAPGVSVQGNRVSIRGGGPPLFIIDGVPIGNSYLGAKEAVNPIDIASVEVISGPEAAIYGRRGGNGVIIIRTRSF